MLKARFKLKTVGCKLGNISQYVITKTLYASEIIKFVIYNYIHVSRMW